MRICRRFPKIALQDERMKKKFLFCTRMRVYLTELPIILLFIITLHYNKYSEEVMKLYPLLIFLGAAMLFILVYFFRAISISFEEIRYHGLYSSRDHAEINEGKEIILTMCNKRRIRVELFGNDGRPPELSWISEEDYKPVDIYLFRGKAIGTKKTVKSLLKYFGVDEGDIDSVFSSENFSGDYEFVSLRSEKKEEQTVIRLRIKQTV